MFFFPCDLYPPQQVALNVLGQRLPPPPLSLKLAQLRPWLSPGWQGVQGTTVAPLVLGKTWERYYTVTIVTVLALMYHMYRFTMFVDRDFVNIPSIRSMNTFARVLFFAVQMLFFAMAQDQGLRLVGTGMQLGPCWVENFCGVKQDTSRPATPSLVATPKWEACQLCLALCFCRFGSYLLFMMANSTLFWQQNLQLVYFWSSTWKERVSPHTDSWNPISASISLKASPNLRTQLWVDCWADRVGGRSNVEGIWTESHRCIDWDWWYLEW